MEASMAGDAMTPAAVLDAMPHRPPFRFIDEILELDEDHIVAAYRYSADADFYRGHFPGNPITPGVLLLEAMAQAGVVAHGQALREGRSGVRAIAKLAELGFGCQVAGVPEGADERAGAVFAADELLAMNSNHRFAGLAAVEAWEDAGLRRPPREDGAVDWATGAVLGTGIGGMDTIGERVVPFTDGGKLRRLGSTAVEQVMASGISARVAGLLALGNQVTTNSSACSTGTEAIVESLERIRSGRAERMLCGGSEGASHYTWAGFDAMRVLTRASNDAPERASRPMSASAAGLVPAAGAGGLLLESLESALERGAPIRA